MKLDDGRVFGGVGTLLLFTLVVPYFGVLTWLFGYIMLLIGIKRIADFTKRPKVFSYFLTSVIISMLGFPIFIALGGVIGVTQYGQLLWVIIAGVVYWILSIVAALFVKRSFSMVAQATGVRLFRTTGTVYVVGAILHIIGIGFVITFVGLILQTVSFFSIETKEERRRKRQQQKEAEQERQ